MTTHSHTHTHAHKQEEAKKAKSPVEALADDGLPGPADALAKQLRCAVKTQEGLLEKIDKTAQEIVDQDKDPGVVASACALERHLQALAGINAAITTATELIKKAEDEAKA